MKGTCQQSGGAGRRAALSSAIPAVLFPVRARFRDLILQRMMTLEVHRIDFNAGNEPQRALSGIVALAHKIAGVAETLGFPEAGRLAATLEQHSGDGLARQLPLTDLWRSVEPQLIALLDELELLLDD